MDFWDIYHNHYERVRKFIFALVKDEWVADDLIQETFIKVQKSLNQLKEETKLSSWIFKIAYNLCQDHYRKMSRTSKDHSPGILEIPRPVFERGSLYRTGILHHSSH